MGLTANDATHLNRLVKHSENRRSEPKRRTKNKCRTITTPRNTVVNLNENGIPVDLLGGGEHFAECPPRPMYPLDVYHPMDDMITIVKENKLIRPTVS